MANPPTGTRGKDRRRLPNRRSGVDRRGGDRREKSVPVKTERRSSPVRKRTERREKDRRSWIDRRRPKP